MQINSKFRLTKKFIRVENFKNEGIFLIKKIEYFLEIFFLAKKIDFNFFKLLFSSVFTNQNFEIQQTFSHDFNSLFSSLISISTRF